MTLNARFSQLRRNEGRIGGGGGGVRRGGIVKRNAPRGGTVRNRLLALQMANRPTVRAALTRGGGRGGRGGRGGFVPRGGYRQGGYQQQQQGFQQGGYRQQNQRRGGSYGARAAVIAAIHSSQTNIPAFRVNNRGNNRQYNNTNRVQTYVNRPNYRPQQQQIQRVTNRGAIQRVGRGRGGLRGRGNITNRVNLNVQRKLPVQERLGVRRQTFQRGTARVQRGRGVQQKTRGVQRGGRLQVQQGRQQLQKKQQTQGVKKATVKRVAGGKIVKATGAKATVAAKRGLIKRGAGIKRGATAVRRGSRVLARGGAARAGSRVVQRGRPALRGRAGVGRAGARGRGARARIAAGTVRTKIEPPSKESLDLDLENYMANTKTFLDKDIDSYMMSQPQGTVSAINPITAP